MRTLDPIWRPLLGQVRDDRTLGFDIDAIPRPVQRRRRGVRGVRREVGGTPPLSPRHRLTGCR